jgi:hypothetical protein
MVGFPLADMLCDPAFEGWQEIAGGGIGFVFTVKGAPEGLGMVSSHEFSGGTRDCQFRHFQAGSR